MAIKPYLIEVIGIDLWHAVEFSSYGCALAFHENSRSARAAAKLITGFREGSNRV